MSELTPPIVAQDQLKPEDSTTVDMSTYQWITFSRILESYGLSLSIDSIYLLSSARTSWVYTLLDLSLEEVFTGIILDQVNAYRVYLDKILAEYLISGFGNEEQKTEEEAAENSSKVMVEDARLDAAERASKLHNLVEENKNLQSSLKDRLDHFFAKFKNTFRISIESWLKQNSIDIAYSLAVWFDVWVDAKHADIKQEAMQRLMRKLQIDKNEDTQRSLYELFASFSSMLTEVDEIKNQFYPKIMQYKVELDQYRTNYYHAIAALQSILLTISGFKFNEELNERARDELRFDSKIGATDSSVLTDVESRDQATE